jgi:radical SAM domain protein
MHCTYCYQQNDKTLEKKLISDETLDKILSIIAQYMEANPNKTVRLGLFGGEPLLIENEKVIDKILQFCKEHKTTVHITTNGSFLSYYLKKFIINRRFISGIYPTIDSMALNYMTRYDLDPSRNNTNETFKLLCCIKTLLHYGIHVDLGTNIDRHNHKEIWNTLDDLKKLQLLQDKNFAWTIGRVDDRLYETNFPDIMMESEILAELQSKPLPDNVHAAFLKTCYNFADKMGLKLNLREHKQTHSYCWSTSSSSNVFYVDMNLKTYRCTCTVGRSRYSLFDFSYENLTNYRPVAVTCNSYAECKDCKIGGFCGGGCQLSHQIDFKKCCTYEEEVFSHFMKTLFIPYIKSKYNEVNQNERKAENRCT